MKAALPKHFVKGKRGPATWAPGMSSTMASTALAAKQKQRLRRKRENLFHPFSQLTTRNGKNHPRWKPKSEASTAASAVNLIMMEVVLTYVCWKK